MGKENRNNPNNGADRENRRARVKRILVNMLEGASLIAVGAVAGQVADRNHHMISGHMLDELSKSVDADLLDRHDKGLPPEYCKPVAIELGYSEDKITFSFAGHEFHIDRSALTERGTERLGGNDYVCAGRHFVAVIDVAARTTLSQVKSNDQANQYSPRFHYEQQNDENDAGGYFGGDIQLLIIPDGDNDETLEGDSLHTSVGLREGPYTISMKDLVNDARLRYARGQVDRITVPRMIGDELVSIISFRQPKEQPIIMRITINEFGTPGVQYDETNLSELNAFISRYSSLDLPPFTPNKIETVDTKSSNDALAALQLASGYLRTTTSDEVQEKDVAHIKISSGWGENGNELHVEVIDLPILAVWREDKNTEKMVRRDFDLTEYFDNISEMSLLTGDGLGRTFGVLIRSNAGYDVVFNLPGENQSLRKISLKKAVRDGEYIIDARVDDGQRLQLLLNDGAQVTSDSLFDGSGNLKGGLSLSRNDSFSGEDSQRN
ncbi:hypothetical protein KC921_00120 [Candidatus Woesebacteria bacterium]|nr:hypothetical protein [Candidatus Woesebacteria bacterium]